MTGASSGIGAAIALAFGAAGARVAVNYRSQCDEAEAIAARIRDPGGEALVVEADVADEAQIGRMFDDVVAAFGHIDILIANAGLPRDAPITEMSLADWSRVIDGNLTGQFLCMREAIRRFAQQTPTGASRARGKIVCMSSVHEVMP